jgi:hypothetical protein
MWEYLVGIINEPVRTLREVAEKRLWREGLLLVIVVTLIGGAVSVVSLKMNPPVASDISSDPTLVHFFSILYSPAVFFRYMMVSGILFDWFIAGVIYYGISRLFKGQGSLPGMLASLGFAETPLLVSVPLTALALSLGPSWILVSSVPGFVAGIWTLVLEVLAIRESQSLDTGQAIGVLLFTVAAMFALVVIMVFLVVIIAAIIAVATGSATG